MNINIKNYKDKINPLLHEDPAKCYQCGKCSAGCPVREFTNIPPNRVVRYVQLGMYEKALTSPSIWLCAGCLTCEGRCPQNYHIPKLMDTLRQIALEENIVPTDKKAAAFHKAFLNQIKKYGRSFELGLVIDYKMKTLDFLQDLALAPDTLMKSKMSLLPPKRKGSKEINKIFEKAEALTTKNEITSQDNQRGK